MGEDERAVEVNRLLVVLCGLGEFAQDEVQLGAVVVNIGVVLVAVNGELEVVSSGILVSYLIISDALVFSLLR